MRLTATTIAALLLGTASSILPTTEAQLIENVRSGCVDTTENIDPEIDYFPEKYVPPSIYTYDTDVNLYGETFVPSNTTDLLEITYHQTYKIVTNKHQNVSYLLYQCGTVPPQEEIDSGRHHLVLSVPHTGGIAITQTPQIPPMELLGLREEIIGYIGNPEYVSSPCMRYLMMGNESTMEVVWDAEDPWNSTVAAALKADFLDRHPDVIVLGGPTDEAPFGARTMNVAASQERTNVATFDWLAFYAALFNLEALSNKIARETQARYDCASTNARMIVDQQRSRSRRQLADAPPIEAPVAEEKQLRQLEGHGTTTSSNTTNSGDVKILWATYFNGYNWSVADCSTWDSAYYCEYAAHCGTTIITRPPEMGYFTSFGGPTKYYYVNDDELLELGKDADVWIYPSNTWESVYESKADVLDQFKAVQTQQVYDNQGSGSNAWFEQRLAEYDVVGLDMCDIVGTSNPQGPLHVRRWFRNVFTEEIGSLPECRIPEELTEPYVPRGAECKLLTEADFLMESEITGAEGEPATEGEPDNEEEETPADTSKDSIGSKTKDAVSSAAFCSVGMALLVLAGLSIAV